MILPVIIGFTNRDSATFLHLSFRHSTASFHKRIAKQVGLTASSMAVNTHWDLINGMTHRCHYYVS